MLAACYETVIGKENAPQQVIDEDMAGGWYMALSPDRSLGMSTHQVHLNSIGAEIKELEKPDVGALVDDTKGGVGRNIV